MKIAAAAVGGEGDNMMIMNKKHKKKIESMLWHRRLIAGPHSINAFSCGVYGRKSESKRGLSTSPPKQCSFIRLSPTLCILVGVSVIDTLKNSNLYCISPHISSFCFCLCYGASLLCSAACSVTSSCRSPFSVRG